MASIERPRRPASVVFLAVCQLIVGTVGLVYEIAKAGSSVMLLVSPAMAKTAADSNPAVGLTLQVPYFLEGQLAASSVGLILSLVLIADGIGLLLLRRWAYNLGILYGWISIIYQVAWMAYLLLIAMPVMMAGIENMPAPAGTPNAQTFREVMRAAEIFDIASTGGGLLYPIFVLIMLAVTRKAFRRPKPAAEAAEEYDPGAAASPYAAEEPSPGYRGEPDDRIGPAGP
jgi:hypothetical protein